MKSNLVPEPRPDINGKIVIRHVRADQGKAAHGASIPKPTAAPKSILQSVSLKEMDSGALTVALLRDIRELERQGTVHYDTVFNALDAATFLHLDQTRANRKNLPRTPYIEHPLRNTLRVARWGCSNEDVLVATLLHDTVEDWADKIVSHYLGRDDVDSLNEHEKRELALGWVEDTYGPRVLHLVKAVSNAVDDGTKKSEAVKHREYAQHVEEAIKGDAEVFLVKFADYVDNAVGLHHNNTEGNRASVARRARKYVPLIDIFEKEFEANEDSIRSLVNEEGYKAIWDHIQEARVRLVPLSRQSA